MKPRKKGEVVPPGETSFAHETAHWLLRAGKRYPASAAAAAAQDFFCILPSDVSQCPPSRFKSESLRDSPAAPSCRKSDRHGGTDRAVAPTHDPGHLVIIDRWQLEGCSVTSEAAGLGPGHRHWLR